MGNVIGCVAAGLGWCFCTASSSLCTSCCGSDKSSTIPPSATSGRRRSVLLLILSIGIAFAFQYGVAPALQPDGSAVTDLPFAGQYLIDSWTSGCDDYASTILQEKCAGNSGVYRVAGSTFLFFILAAIAAVFKPTANREAWPAKFVLFLFLIAGTIFIPNDPLFNPILLNIFRIGAVIFIVFQQIIILDLAYNLNESWVEKGNKAEEEEGEGAGKKWFGALLGASALLFSGSIVVIGLMFHYFSGCKANEAFISITLIMGVVSTVVQLMGEESSLFTSAAIFAYGTYLCFTAVSKNPNELCNPSLGEEDVAGIVLGVAIALLSMSWTGWSLTAHAKVGSDSDAVVEERTEGNINDDGVKGVVVDEYGSLSDRDNEQAESDAAATGREFSNSWKVNIIVAIVCCWYGMALTGWGSVESGGNSANPDVGNVSMWMIISSQWLMLSLYLWTLVAPKVFPDRDFS